MYLKFRTEYTQTQWRVWIWFRSKFKLIPTWQRIDWPWLKTILHRQAKTTQLSDLTQSTQLHARRSFRARISTLVKETISVILWPELTRKATVELMRSNNWLRKVKKVWKIRHGRAVFNHLLSSKLVFQITKFPIKNNLKLLVRLTSPMQPQNSLIGEKRLAVNKIMLPIDHFKKQDNNLIDHLMMIARYLKKSIVWEKLICLDIRLIYHSTNRCLIVVRRVISDSTNKVEGLHRKALKTLPLIV